MEFKENILIIEAVREEGIYMNFAKNLQMLRKNKKITQEDLAERLGVSRQSVSKWETGEGYPEMDKLILMSDWFGISVDDLLRGDLQEDGQEETIKKSEVFHKIINHFSLAISLGVFLILFGVAGCVALNGYATGCEKYVGEVLGIISAVIVIVFVAAAIFLFIFFGMSYEKYKKDHPVMEAQFSEEEIQSFSKRFILWMAVLVSGILLDVVLLILLSTFIDMGAIKIENKDAGYCYVTAMFLLILAFIVGKLVYLGIQHQKYDISEYNRNGRINFQSDFHFRLSNALCGTIMMLATIIFLILGFGWQLWHPGWLCFPVGGILCGIVTTLLKIKEDSPAIK